MKEGFEMKITITKRNRIVEEYLWCIEKVMQQNRHIMKAANLDLDDVYQDLALRLIRTVADYEAGEDTLEQHILSQLQKELRTVRKRYGIRSTRNNVHSIVISLDALADRDPNWEIQIAV